MKFIYLPHGKDGKKVGLDDFLAAGHTTQDLLDLATSNLKEPPQKPEKAYEETETGIVWNRPVNGGGTIATPLTNFTARIVSDVQEDDGADTTRHMEIEATHKGRTSRFTIPAGSFDGLAWAHEHIGAGATYYPGNGAKDHARFAVVQLSGDIPCRTVYGHTGWRQVGETWVYLHAGGIGNVSEGNLAVRLQGALANFALPEPPTGQARIDAVRASLNLLRLGKPEICYPLLCAIYRAPLASCNFSINLVGPTQVFKSQLAALAQQHYGQAMEARNLPASWSSTGNALEALLFAAKDALLVIDDYAPNGSVADVQRLNSNAERVGRGQGNNAGRGRARTDGSVRNAKPPRGLAMWTSEDLPTGQSLKARMFIVEIARGDIDANVLTECQRDAAAGKYTAAMAAYLAWLAPHYSDVSVCLRAHVERFRDKAAGETVRGRTPEQIGELALGLSWFLEFASGIGVITKQESTRHWEQGWQALQTTGKTQAEHQQESSPALRFRDLVVSALASGQAHVANPQGDRPPHSEVWGWRYREGRGLEDTGEWQPQGTRIGWVDGEDVYLEQEAVHSCVRKLSQQGGELIVLSQSSLNKRLAEAKLLASTDEARGTIYKRKIVQGAKRRVLHFSQDTLLSPETDKTDKSIDSSSSLPQN